MVFTPDQIYRVHSNWFPMPRANFDVVLYCFLELSKLLFIALSLVPYLALLIIG